MNQIIPKVKKTKKGIEFELLKLLLYATPISRIHSWQWGWPAKPTPYIQSRTLTRASVFAIHFSYFCASIRMIIISKYKSTNDDKMYLKLCYVENAKIASWCKTVLALENGLETTWHFVRYQTRNRYITIHTWLTLKLAYWLCFVNGVFFLFHFSLKLILNRVELVIYKLNTIFNLDF